MSTIYKVVCIWLTVYVYFVSDVQVCVCVCLSVCLSVCVCVSVCAHVCVCGCMGVYVIDDSMCKPFLYNSYIMDIIQLVYIATDIMHGVYPYYQVH